MEGERRRTRELPCIKPAGVVGGAGAAGADVIRGTSLEPQRL